MNFQGELTDPGTGDPVADGSYSIRFSIWDLESLGSEQWNETQNVTVSGGLFSVLLGSVTPVTASVFAESPRYLEVKVGADPALSPRQQFVTVPYAFHAVNAWALDGNSGTTAGTDVLGTTDNEPMELYVNGARALRLEPNVTSPNLIGGFSGNSVTGGTAGATIGGGGNSGLENQITADYGTVGGGRGNQAALWATVSGGNLNTASAWIATVGGGQSNTANGQRAVVGGGDSNTASNTAATVAGGTGNTASGTIAAVGGGSNNIASSSGATAAGGQDNTASGQWASIGGGAQNTASGQAATVGGGESNTASGSTSTVAGGGFNTASAIYAVVGGGQSNTASAWYATIGGGQGNSTSLTPSLSYATIGGGLNNTASGQWATVGGGQSNVASNLYATVGGGVQNTASGQVATVGGGDNNSASGSSATVAGGSQNTAAGAFSFAAGFRAKVNAGHGGTFLFADSAAFVDFNSAAVNEFAVCSTGGARFVSAINLTTGAPTAGVSLAAGGGSWSSISDRSAKANFASVDGRDVLERLASIPIESWNLKSQDASIRHIGPMAQDFYAAFAVGEDDLHITTVDADGVALAAIQGLYELVQDQEAQIAALEKRLEGAEGAPGVESATSPSSSSGLPTTWLIVGALVVAGLVLGTVVLGRRVVRRARSQ